ncbi:hypothetical protein [Coralliovum pocilloporae]|uniref:hypothetical protein n=1 Tax=Coralliovum pocilloporae TaxID=3066369 RepID=UPI0033070FD2
MKPVLLMNINGVVLSETYADRRAFVQQFLDAGKKHHILLLSGMSYDHVYHVLPEPIRKGVTGIISGSGSELWRKDNIIWQQDATFPKTLTSFVDRFIHAARAPTPKGGWITPHSASLSFNLAGHMASRQMRHLFSYYDGIYHYRDRLRRAINTTYSDLEATLAGYTSINVVPKFGGFTQAVKFIANKIERPNFALVSNSHKDGMHLSSLANYLRVEHNAGGQILSSSCPDETAALLGRLEQRIADYQHFESA